MTDTAPFTTNLSPAETERLALLMEEMAEASQLIGKILRHGFESRHPEGGPTNRELLTTELGHVSYAVSLCTRAGDVQKALLLEAEWQKSRNVIRWLHHQDPRDLL